MLTSTHQVGVGLRSTHFPHIETRPNTAVEWFEAVSENFLHTEGRPLEILEQVRSDFPIALHGVGMNIANPDGLNDHYLNDLKLLVDRVNPFLVSDHLCWSGTNAHGHLHDLLPLPLTEEVLKYVSINIDRAQNYLRRPIAFENVSTYLSFKHSEMSESQFVSEVLKRTGCKLLLDINNVFVNSVNHTFDPQKYIDGLPLDQVAQIHLAGHTTREGYLFDTHSDFVTAEVWNLFAYTARKLPLQTPLLVEWDENIPSYEIVENEAVKAKAIWDQARE